MTVSIELSIDRSLLLDILVDGMDYVCRGYWGQIEEYKWKWWYTADKVGDPTGTIAPNITDNTVLCCIRDDEDGKAEEENRPFVDITLAKLEQAFGWTLQHFPHTIVPFETNSSGTIIDCNQDAETQDIMIQYICFGEVVYG